MKQTQNKITCCYDCAPLMPDYPLCRNVSCPCHKQLIHKGADQELPEGTTQYCLRCEHPLNLDFEHTCVIPENAHEIGSSGRLPANHSEIRSKLAVPSMREEWNKYIDERQGFYDYGSESNEAIGIADFWLFHLTTERTALIEELKAESNFIGEGIQACKDDSAQENCVGEELHYIFGKSQTLKIIKGRIDAIMSHLELDNQKTQ